IDLILYTGVYRSEFISEPAVAAIVAGRLGINHEENRTSGRRTLAFDLLNGAAGTLSACFAAGGLIAARKFTRPLIVASEVDLNRVYCPSMLLGLEETASAFVLEESSTAEGFSAFGYRAFPEHAHAVVSATGIVNEGPAVLRRRSADFEENA